MTLLEKDAKYIWHPFTAQKNMPYPIAITHGKDSWLFDEQGNGYIDAISSWWVTIHGHANETIAKAIYQQAMAIEQVIFAGFTHAPAVQLAEALLPLLPGNMHKIFYSDNGSTSTEVALKMAVQFWWNKEGSHTKRTKILAFHNSYHGDTFGSMSVSDRSVFTTPFAPLFFDVVFIPTPKADNLAETIATITEHATELAAFIYEPLVQGAGGIQMYEAELLNQILEHCKSFEMICIADEVMTGFGRTGTMFASEQLTAKPDIICLSKGLTGGTMALGITACKQFIYDAFVSDDATKTFFHGHSFTANPLACTAAFTSLQLFQQNHCLEKIKIITSWNQQLIANITNLPGVINARVLGTIAAFELQQSKNNYLSSIATQITQYALSKGVFIRPLGNTVYIMPPYCITNTEYDKIVTVLLEIIKDGYR
ncbi:MAG: adenosylmethionine--8-amino-7-oxononanoate transaminase [Bacteroidetes bacterium]|nr:MAG: adenosylmethionine--8-amino-7-oxononanoate transaminase [Bacteroidota bacterium]TAE66517.1 MAG: adenosylmethionine--8-amino-7-oxononanoate transaminase [Bacteroidota bacterium]TAF92920.1 MAG: adenosylmethionine--8-amino-7-oxononanoate transaminase [Bacteroidota bacterium]